jgi:hypothetical protein
MSENMNTTNGKSGWSAAGVVGGAINGSRKGLAVTKEAAIKNGFGRAWTALRTNPEATLPTDYDQSTIETVAIEPEAPSAKLENGISATKRFASSGKRRGGAAWEELTSKGKAVVTGLAAVLLVFGVIVPSHGNSPAKVGDMYWKAFYQGDAKQLCQIGYRSLDYGSYERCTSGLPRDLSRLTAEQRSYLKDQHCKTYIKEGKFAEVECHGNYDWDTAYLGLERQGHKWIVIETW